MLTTTLKGALAHKARLAMTSLAILLGVAFVSGSLVFTDTIQARFDTLFTDVYAGTDVSVRAEAPEFGTDPAAGPGSVPQSLVQTVGALPGVAAAEGYVQGFGQVIDASGAPVGGMGPPTYVYSWIADSGLNPFLISEGRAPEVDGEVVVDAATARLAGLTVGDRIEVAFESGAHPFDLVGIASFGDSTNLAGATISVITLDQAQRILGLDDQVTFIDVAAQEGTDATALASQVGQLLPDGVEAVTGDQLMSEAIDGFTAGLGFLSAALLAFAGVAVLVGAFIIANTFRIIVSQRTRELALLRALGASSRQVLGVVLGEAVIVATVASAAGVVAGIGFAQLIKAGMSAVGFGPPDGPLTVAPRTIVVGMLVGIVITVLSALAPALRAARIAPVIALQDSAGARSPRRVRSWPGMALLALGVAGLCVGLISDQGLVVAAGAVAVLVAALLLAPVLARPVVSTVGRLFPGAAGQLARGNASRDPRRSAATASALTIGIALVVFTAIFARSATSSIAATVEESFPGDLTVSSSNMYLPVSEEAQRAIAAADGVDRVSALSAGPARVDGTDTLVTAFDAATLTGLLDSGADIPITSVGAGVLVESSLARERALVAGDRVTVALPGGGSDELVVAGTFRNAALGQYAVERATWQRLGGGSDAYLVLVGLSPDVTLTQGQDAVDAALAAFPALTVQTASEQVAAAVAQVDALLVLFTALLGMALLIAVLGIANTLALSIVERTREIGLLRAVGMTRRQVRIMITEEAVAIALFGALLGAVVGLGLGWVVVAALSEQGLSSFAVPVTQVAAWLAVAALAGVLAAAVPARSASRLDVLRAIAHE